MVAPRPLFLAGGDVPVGNVDEPALRRVVVAAEEVVLRRAYHVRSRHGDVLVPAEVVRALACGIIDSVVLLERLGEGRHRAHRVVGDVLDVRREEALVPVVDTRSDVRPPEERLRERRAVGETRLQLDETASGLQADAMRAPHARQGIVVAHPHRHTAVLVLLDLDVGGHERGGTMMLRPVELHAAAHPRAGESDKRGLDHVVAVEEVVVAVLLVLGDVNATAEFRQKHEAHVLVLKRHRVVLLHRRRVVHLVDERHGIHLPARSLVDSLLEEHRVLLRLAHRVRLDCDLLALDFHLKIAVLCFTCFLYHFLLLMWRKAQVF